MKESAQKILDKVREKVDKANTNGDGKDSENSFNYEIVATPTSS